MNLMFKKFSNVELLGRFLTKEINNSNIINLSEEVSISIYNLTSSKKLFIYNLYLVNKNKNKNSTWENLSFEIKQSMNISLFLYDNTEYLQWITENNAYFFEILIDKDNENNKNNFIKILNQYLYSSINNISFENISKNIDIDSIDYIINIGIINNFENHVNKVISLLEDKNKKEYEDEQINKEINNLKLTPIKLDNIINLDVAKKIFSAKGEMYNYDINKEELVNLNVNKKSFLTIYQTDKTKNVYILCSETFNEYIISIDKITEKIYGQIISDKNKKFFCWTTNKCFTNIVGNCIGFIFDQNEDCDIFKKILDKALYESKNNNISYQNNFNNNISNISLKQRKYNTNISFHSSYEEDVKELKEGKEGEGEEEEEKEEKDNENNNTECYEVMDIDEVFREIESSKETLNKFSLDSLTNDRTYCINDDNEIVSYKINQENDSIEKISSDPIIQEYSHNQNLYENNNNANFKNGLLYKSENNIVFLNENNPYSLYQYDLPKQKIINEWKTEKIPILDICPMIKNGQATDNPIIYGVNRKSVFTMDDRVNNRNNIVQMTNYSKNIFSDKIMSSNNGEFVTGTTRGELRLYDKIGKKAKNLYSFYGDSVKHIDISSDDNYILITCDQYLLLINIMSYDGKKNGFHKNLRTNNRKVPIRLQLKNSDVNKFGLVEACYTAAKFNVNKNGENNIITSLGDYVIVWNFNDIKKGKIANYKIKKVNDLIIDNTFKVGNGNKIVITMPTKIRIQNQKKIFSK